MKIWFLLPLILIFIDQFSKKFVLGGFRYKLGFFEITLVYNEGSAFGFKIFKNHEYILINSILLILFSIFIFYKSRNNSLKNFYFLSLTLIISGGIGNIIDRILYGKVVDFISFYNFPVFNFADSFITVGFIIFVICIFIDSRN